jgi:tRNA(Arg) A34 adenosine deaminase TadA
MPQTLYSFFQTPEIKTPAGGNNVAGFIDGDTFKYFESDNLMLPAVINALEIKERVWIYTNSIVPLWIKNYPGIKVRFMDRLQANEGDGSSMVTPVLQTTKKWPRQLSALALPAPLPEGGLHAAAAGLSKALDLPADSREKGLARALRYSMLATYALVDISAAEAYEGLKNFVGALLVSDKGQILAAGINTGSFRHAEVSMLLTYFRNNPAATKIPENSVIFSTLTPCKGCTGYLSVAKSSNCVIYFGQEDTGKDGRAGNAISTQISKSTKEPLGQSKAALPGAAEPGKVSGEGVVSVGSASGVYKIQVDKGLSSCMGDGSIATQIGTARNAREVLNSASEALIQKMLKTRSSGTLESAVKTAVLQHIGQWLGTSKSIA